MTDAKRPSDADELEPADDEAGAPADELDAADDEVDAEEIDAEEIAAEDFDDDLESPLDEPATTTTVADPKTPASSRGRRARGAAAGTAAAEGKPVTADDLPYVDDRVSKIWVGAIIATFLLILAYGFFLGKGGLLTTTPAPSPSPSPAPSSSPSVSPSRTPGATPSVTIGPSGSPGTSTSPAASPSAVPASVTPAPASATPAPASTATAAPT
jgi:hypothetical protein